MISLSVVFTFRIDFFNLIFQGPTGPRGPIGLKGNFGEKVCGIRIRDTGLRITGYGFGHSQIIDWNFYFASLPCLFVIFVSFSHSFSFLIFFLQILNAIY